MALAVCLSGPISAAPTPATSPPVPAATPPTPLTPDRPGFTNSSDVVLPGRFQIESGLAETRVSAATGGAETTDYPESLVRFGLSPVLELRVGLPDYFTTPGGPDGFGDGLLGVKYKIYQSKDGNTKAALTPAVTLPVGARAFTSRHVDPLLTLAAQTVSGARWGLSANVFLSDPTQNGRRDFTTAPSGAVSYQMTPALAAYGELYDSIPRRGAPSPLADGGFTYLLNPNLQLDVETGAGLGGGAPVRFYGGGVSMRL